MLYVRLTDERIENYTQWIISKNRIIVIVTFIIFLLFNTGLSRVDYAVDYRIFFSREYPQLAAFEDLQNIYTKNDNILFAIAPSNGDIFVRDNLEIIRSLVNEAWKIPYAIRVDAITNYQKVSVQNDVLYVDDLVPDGSVLSDEFLSEIRGFALNDPLLVNRLLSSEGDVAGINVVFQFPGESINEGPKAVANAREIARKILIEHPEIELYLSGTTMLDNAFSEGVFEDLRTLIPLMYLIIIAIMGISFRSVSATCTVVSIIAFAVVSAMSFSGWMGIKLSPASASAPTMIMTIAVADSIHIMISMLRRMRNGLSKIEALTASMQKNLKPVLLTSITTCFGFLTLNFNDSPPFHDLGNITAFGVVMAFGLSVFFLPALISLLPVRVKRSEYTRRSFFELLAGRIIASRKSLLVITCIAVITLASFIPLNVIDDRFVEYFDESVDFRKDTDFIMNNLTGIYYFGFSLSSGSTGGACDPEYLRMLDEFAEWLKMDQRVIHVYSFSDIIKKVNQNLNGGDPAYYNIPDSRELAAQYLLMYELSLPFGLDLNNLINIDKSATRFTVTLDDVSTSEIREIAGKAENWLSDNSKIPVNVTAAGTSVMFAHIFDSNIKGMLVGITAALILISLLLLISFDSIKFGLISLVPNLIPCLLAFGLWGIAVGEIGLALSGVGAMTLGIVVDDTIHFLHNYLKARRQLNKDVFDAVKYTFVTVGAELFTTSLILIGGFIILTFSAFKINSDLGTMTAITIAIALLADFILLPVLLMYADNKR